MPHYDLLVIGTGPAGQKAAIQAAKLGKKVGIIERKMVLGGVCINTGTIPSKSLREAVLYLSGFRQRNIYGGEYRLKKTITIEDLAFRANHVIKHEIQIVRQQMARNRVDLLFGTGSFLDPHRLRIETTRDPLELTADFFVIAVGSEPARPPDIPFDDTSIIDTDTLLTLKHIPDSIVIVGGGVIGTEYASILAALGVPVTLIDKRPRLLEFVDDEIISVLQRQMKDLGVRLYHDEAVLAIKKDRRSIAVTLSHNRPIQASTLMYAIGRVGATQSLNLPSIGLQPDARGRLTVNEHFQTTLPHIYAAGDVIGFPALASTSMQQGRHAASHAFGIRIAWIPRSSPTASMPFRKSPWSGGTKRS
jgi:NAD(P) transhydrogenase